MNRKNNNYIRHVNNGTAILLVRSKGEIYNIIVDDDFLPDLLQYKWSITGKGYIRSATTGEHVLLHRYILAKDLQKGMEVDHINGNKFDNRRGNLRVATHQQNLANRESLAGSFSKYKGVAINKQYKGGRIYASITHNGKAKHLGYFDTEEEAARRYDAEAIKLFGEYAKLNFYQLGGVE